MSRIVPIILFAYARPNHMQRTLECLRENRVPLIYAFSDGPRTPDKKPAVAEVRRILHAIDWCDVTLCERQTNLGLGCSILTGTTEVLSRHETAIIFEDDLVCVPGTYNYLCEALKHYRDNPDVMSVTGWTHPAVTPSNTANQPYFDGRAECLAWGTWARAWKGMETDAKTLTDRCKTQGIDIYRYGADLVEMARTELQRNIWAVRLLYWHILNGGLCLRPPWSMTEHIGFDELATNSPNAGKWAAPPLKPCPPIPAQWPQPAEHPQCPELWQQAYGKLPTYRERFYRLTRHMTSISTRCTSSLLK
jgi:hypothetical protein